jgi:cytochrome P450
MWVLTQTGRNEEYLAANVDYTDKFIIIAGLTGAMPKFLRPLVGNLAHILQYFNLRTIRKHFTPLLHERLSLAKATEKTSPSEPQDHLQMMIRYGLAEKPLDIENPKIMTGRLALSNLGSFHQTSLAVTNLIFNILASDREYNTIALLREEIRSVVGGNKTPWTKALVSKLVKCDSVCKENLRINSFGNRGPLRKVVASNLVTPDGIALPKGGMVSILLTSQHDSDFFGDDPLKFNPFRYAEMRERGEEGASFVSLGERFLPFGYGRHACPGRFLLEFELKMILAYLLINYEFELAEEYGGKRPESRWVAEAIMPPLEGKIRVRRRV